MSVLHHHCLQWSCFQRVQQTCVSILHFLLKDCFSTTSIAGITAGIRIVVFRNYTRSQIKMFQGKKGNQYRPNSNDNAMQNAGRIELLPVYTKKGPPFRPFITAKELSGSSEVFIEQMTSAESYPAARIQFTAYDGSLSLISCLNSISSIRTQLHILMQSGVCGLYNTILWL